MNLNVWGLREIEAFQAMMMAKDTIDIYAFTEVTDCLLSRGQTNLCYSDQAEERPQRVNANRLITEMVADTHDVYYSHADGTRRPWTCHQHGTTFDGVAFGSLLCWSKKLTYICDGSFRVSGNSEVSPRTVQYIVFEKDGEIYLFIHFHGVWIRANTKGDTEPGGLRDQQSLMIKKNIDQIKRDHGIEKVILGGDFNLDINTRALRMLEEVGDTPMINHIKRRDITNTRTELYRHYGDGSPLYADYLLTSPEVNVLAFEVMNDCLASDHAPVMAAFE